MHSDGLKAVESRCIDKGFDGRCSHLRDDGWRYGNIGTHCAAGSEAETFFVRRGFHDNAFAGQSTTECVITWEFRLRCCGQDSIVRYAGADLSEDNIGRKADTERKSVATSSAASHIDDTRMIIRVDANIAACSNASASPTWAILSVSKTIALPEPSKAGPRGAPASMAVRPKRSHHCSDNT